MLNDWAKIKKLSEYRENSALLTRKGENPPRDWRQSILLRQKRFLFLEVEMKDSYFVGLRMDAVSYFKLQNLVRETHRNKSNVIRQLVDLATLPENNARGLLLTDQADHKEEKINEPQ